MFRRIIIRLVTGLLISTGAMAVDFEDVSKAYEEGDYRRAYKGFRNLASDQHVKSQYLLGLLYLSGQGTTKDVGQGISWLKQAAENGSYLAAAELGQIYASGNGVKKNDAEAARWIELSTSLADEDDAEEDCD